MPSHAVAWSTMSSTGRRSCPPALRVGILARQHHLCLYCGLRFGSVISRAHALTLTTVEYDHLVPYSYCLSNDENNWVAACNVCNQAKTDKLFSSIGDAAVHIMKVWESKGYYVLWEPSVSSEAPYPVREEWVKEYSNFLAERSMRGEERDKTGSAGETEVRTEILHAPRGSGHIWANSLNNLQPYKQRTPKGKEAGKSVENKPRGPLRLPRSGVTLKQILDSMDWIKID
jgi:HNH endonuclease